LSEYSPQNLVLKHPRSMLCPYLFKWTSDSKVCFRHLIYVLNGLCSWWSVMRLWNVVNTAAVCSKYLVYSSQHTVRRRHPAIVSVCVSAELAIFKNWSIFSNCYICTVIRFWNAKLWIRRARLMRPLPLHFRDFITGTVFFLVTTYTGAHPVYCLKLMG
jgi:hypothetical protein